MRDLVSCSNCWFNGLQYGSIGLSVGYCVRYRTVLRRADETTCAELHRKDLMLDASLAENVAHRRTYTQTDGPQRLDDRSPTTNGEWVTTDTQSLARDGIGEMVVEYGQLGTTIESLAQLGRDSSYRAELALLSLGRGYVANCMGHEGRWTSGIHLTWWTIRRLVDKRVPDVSVTDQRWQLPISSERQLELERWSLVMLRLVFIADVASHARCDGHPVSELADLPERAARALTSGPKLSTLLRWIEREGLEAIQAALPASEYQRLAQELHVARDLSPRTEAPSALIRVSR